MEPSHSSLETETPCHPSFAEKLDIVRQMVASLETVTIAGQRHLMGKVLAFVDGQIDRVVLRASPPNRQFLLQELALLRNETDRQLPSVPVFGRRA
jgi:hypothetical protein